MRFALVPTTTSETEQPRGTQPSARWPFHTAGWYFALSCIRNRRIAALDACLAVAHMDRRDPNDGGYFLVAALRLYGFDTLGLLSQLIGKQPTGLGLIVTQGFLAELVASHVNDHIWNQMALAAGWKPQAIPLTGPTLEHLVDTAPNVRSLRWLIHRVPLYVAATVIVERIVQARRQEWADRRWALTATFCRQYRMQPSWNCVRDVLANGQIGEFAAQVDVITPYYDDIMEYALEQNEPMLITFITSWQRMRSTTLGSHMIACS